jgi:hypothetical protein
MLVIIKGTPIDLPDLEATLLLQRGVAHLPEVADLPIPTDSGRYGIPTRPSRTPATASKQRKSSQGSRKKDTK